MGCVQARAEVGGPIWLPNRVAAIVIVSDVRCTTTPLRTQEYLLLVARHAQGRGLRRDTQTLPNQRNALVLTKIITLPFETPPQANRASTCAKQTASGGIHRAPKHSLSTIHPITSRILSIPSTSSHPGGRTKYDTLTAPLPGYGREGSGC